jgi:hypothetical protein
MFSARLMSCQLVAVLISTLAVAPAALAVAWSDDFNNGSTTDGDPVSWIEDLGGLGYFVGDYDASSGDYRLDPDGTGVFPETMVSFVGVPFTDTYIRTQGILMPDPENPEVNIGGNFVLLGRINPETLDSYILYVDAGGGFALQYAPNGAPTDFSDEVPTAETDLEFNGLSEIIIEMNIVGNSISGFAWQPGQEKPAEPQVFVPDITLTSAPLFAGGAAGVAFQEDDPGTFSIHRYVSAQDTPFVDALAGDYNNDGTVNAPDYTVWRDGGSPDSTQAGYDLWAANFGNSGAGGGAAVPEPAGLVWLVVSIAAAAVVVRRRNN